MYLEKNLELLKAELPELYERVLKYIEDEEKSELTIIPFESKDKSPNIRVETKNKSIALHSTYNPKKEALRYADSNKVELGFYDSIIFFGMGMGYVLEEYIERYPDLNKIVFEKDMGIFIEFLKNRDAEKIIKGKHVLIFSDITDEEISTQIGKMVETRLVYNAYFVDTPAYRSLYEQSEYEIKRTYTDLIKAYSTNYKTLQVFENQWIYNFLANVKHIENASNINGFIDKFKDVPAVVIGSGPSVKKNLHLIEEMYDKALIISAGSSIGLIDKMNLLPHMNLSIDGSKDMSNDINNMLKQEEILFAYLNNVHFDCIEKYKGKKMYVKTLAEQSVDYFEKHIENQTIPLSSGGSCTNVSVDFAKKLGCNPIILIGVDLAYTDLKSHADGILQRWDVEKEEIVEDNVNYIKGKDINGNDIYTSSIWFSMMRGFNEYIEKNKDIKFINATEGGMRMEKATHMTLRDTIDKYCTKTYDIKKMLDECYEFGYEQNKSKVQKVKSFMDKLELNAKKVDKYSKKRIKLVDELLQKIEEDDNRGIEKIKKQLKKLTKKIESNEIFTEYIGYFAAEVIITMSNETQKKIMGIEDEKEKRKILYKGLKEQYEYLKAKAIMIKASIDIIRKQEELRNGELHGASKGKS